MARNDGCFRRRRAESMDGFDDFSPSPAVDAVKHREEEVHVLAVDDSLIDRKVIERLLKITSCKVTAVDSGRRALQFLGLDEEETSIGFDGLKVDLIITDYCMPGMTGYDLLKKIKGSSSFREIPVVIMSSENVLARIDRCLEEGAEDFIVKPVKLADVKRLKSYMFGEDRSTAKEDKGINKRKLQDTSDDFSSPSPSPSPPPSPCAVASPSRSLSSDFSSTPSPPSTSLPSSPKMISSPSSSGDSTTPPCSPSSVVSPTRLLKVTNFD